VGLKNCAYCLYYPHPVQTNPCAIWQEKKIFANRLTSMRKRILLMTQWFYPAFKAGGPVRACHNLALLLRNQYDVYIFTTDRDIQSNNAYATINADQWVDFSAHIKVFYASPESLRWNKIRKEIQEIRPAHIYLNGMYSMYFTIYPLLMKRLGSLTMPIILSPRGMLKRSALHFKYLKKKSFLNLLRFLKINKGISFHATDQQEKNDIIKIFGSDNTIDLIQDIPPRPEENLLPLDKHAGELKLIFIGRIHPIKNLHFVLECLKKLTQKIEFTVVGPIEDRAYYQYCKRLAASVPFNITVQFLGEVANDQIKTHLQRHHFMILPTFGENYCYSIVEAFCASRPVIITDQTPWQGLSEKKIGWDLPVNDQKDFLEALNKAAAMLQGEFTEWSGSALNFSQKLFEADTYRNQYAEMFS
jgi:glycosyltransferase involved in cell wall biosynthesis